MKHKGILKWRCLHLSFILLHFAAIDKQQEESAWGKRFSSTVCRKLDPNSKHLSEERSESKSKWYCNNLSHNTIKWAHVYYWIRRKTFYLLFHGLCHFFPSPDTWKRDHCASNPGERCQLSFIHNNSMPWSKKEKCKILLKSPSPLKMPAILNNKLRQ